MNSAERQLESLQEASMPEIEERDRAAEKAAEEMLEALRDAAAES